MQTANTQTVLYRERLTPSLGILGAAALLGPMVAIVFLPWRPEWSLLAGAATSLAFLALAWLASPTITVTETTLTAGRAHIEREWLGTAVALTDEAAHEARTTKLPGNGWHLIRGGAKGIVRVPLTDPTDPVKVWTISSRTPDRLASALNTAR